MNKLFNVFLLNLIFFSGNHFPEARDLRPVSLKDVRFNEESKHISKFSSSNLKSQTKNENSNEDEYLKNPGKPTSDPPTGGNSQNYDSQELKCPLHLFKTLPNRPFKWSDRWYRECLNEVANRWKNFQDRKRKKRVSRRFSNYHPYNIIDYTNSMMPFNEGKAQPSNSQAAHCQFSDGFWEEENKDLPGSYVASFAEPKRLLRSVLKRRFEVPLMSQENIFETSRDDPILGYSRVRRFLDHERAKKRKRMPGTLEAKEAAMSRILDPNLNLDGILEPHVRKRRGKMNIFLLNRLGHI